MIDLKKRVWKKYFFDSKEGYDFYGFKINIYNFEIDHIYPKSLNGSDDIENLMPISSTANKIKSCYLYGKINGRNFIVKRKKNHQNKIIGELYINEVLISF